MSENSSRPELDNLILKGTKELEGFQNKTLRPILKMKHDLFILSFKDYIEKRKITFQSLSLQQKNKHIEASLTKDIAYKNIQLGIVLGQLSLDEFTFYQKNSREVSKRILQMLKKRLKDSLSEISA